MSQQHVISREYCGKGIERGITPVCTCGWRGVTEYAWNDYQHSNVADQERDHAKEIKAEPTELERLQEENRLIRDAIKEAFDLLLDGENTRAGSTLQPFIKP